MDLVYWATASAMILASAASLNSWSWSLALLEVVAFSSQVLSLPITKIEKCQKQLLIDFHSVLYFRTSGFEALKLL